MKITKRHLRSIIKEEKVKILREAGNKPVWPEVEFPSENPYDDDPPVHMSGRNQSVMGQLHTAIDALIKALGNQEAHMELQGIVDEWDSETY